LEVTLFYNFIFKSQRDIGGSHSQDPEHSNRLLRYAVSTGKYLPKFQRIALPSSSGASIKQKSSIFTLQSLKYRNGKTTFKDYFVLVKTQK
jgi:hypothetical protein